MRSLPLAAAVVALVACAGQPRPPRPTPALPVPAPDPTPPALPAVERAGYVILRGADTVLVEHASRTRDLLSGDLSVRGQGDVEYQASLEPAQTVSRLVVGLVPRSTGAAAGVAQRSTASFVGDTVVVETVQGDSVRTTRFATREGAIPYINPSVALTEQILRRARAVGGSQVELPVLLTSGSIQTVTASVTFTGSDSARIALGGAELRLATDSAGRVLGGVVPSQGLTIARTSEPPRAP